MTSKIATSALAFVFLVAGAQPATGHQFSGLSPRQPSVVIAADLGPAGGATGDAAALVPNPEDTDQVIRWIDATGLDPIKFPMPGTPHFLAEPEDPTKVRFIAEPEDLDLVCSVPVADGPIDVCDVLSEPQPKPVPGYELAPSRRIERQP